ARSERAALCRSFLPLALPESGAAPDHRLFAGLLPLKVSHDPRTRKSLLNPHPRSTPVRSESLSTLCAWRPLSIALADIRSWLHRTPARRSAPTGLAKPRGTSLQKTSGIPR